jgi:cell wall-associated NlpC family hydrolase
VAAEPSAFAPTQARDARANAVSIHAIGLVGTPYRYGGNTPAGGFDCSGLVGFVYRESAGLALPRTTAELARLDASEVDAGDLRVGDLVLFGSRRRVDHIGIYVGERRFVHAPSSGGTVRLDSLESDYWKRRVRGGRRLI